MPKSRNRKKPQLKFHKSALYAEELFGEENMYLTKLNKPPCKGKIITLHVIKKNTQSAFKERLIEELQDKSISLDRREQIFLSLQNISQNLGVKRNVKLRVTSYEYDKSIGKYKVLLKRA